MTSLRIHLLEAGLLFSAVLLAGCGGGSPGAAGSAAAGASTARRAAADAPALQPGRYVLRNANSGKCVEVAGGSTADGANIQQNSCTGGLNQAFDVSEPEAGLYKLLNAASGKAMDVSGASAADQANIQQWVDNGTGAQRFRMQRSADGRITLVNLNSGKCVDVSYASSADGANIWQWACNGTGAQQFFFEPVGDAVPDFGPNVKVFDPSMPAADIQAAVDQVFAQQETNQFGTQRYAFLFKPGSYQASVRVGFYTQVLGLGATPDAVTLNGSLQVDAAWMNQNATQNFWRSAENFSVVPSSGTVTWAVAQAAPFRRMHVRGNLYLFDRDGWSSGGFIADAKVDGTVLSGSQQQWLSRNAEFGNWQGGVWNMVFVGVQNAPAPSFPNPPHTVIDQTPLVREKPYLTVEADGRYNVIVPALASNTRGITWAGGTAAGSQTIPLSQFYVVRSDRDNAASINAALSAGRHLLFTPGVYRLDQTLRVSRANTVVLGLGMATLLPTTGQPAMAIDDVDGVKIAGLLFDAGERSSPTLLEVGPAGSSANHAANPISLHDLFFRVGGTGSPGRADSSIRINSNQVIGDHFWVWRADHGDNVGWTQNTTTNGLIVDGADATVYGLFVEHFHQYQTVWNGNGGRLFFYQSEIPYDVPDQASWMNNGANGFASYKVGRDVTIHEAWGLGIYCFFQTNPSVKLGSAIEAPERAGVRFRNMTTVSLGGKGEITHILNNRGDTVNAEPGKDRATLVQ